MIKDDLITFVQQSIKKYGVNPNRNKFLQVLQQLNGNWNFVSAADANILPQYIDLLNSGKIGMFKDPAPLTSQDDWDQGEGYKAWLYKIKILPYLEQNQDYKDAYKQIFDGRKILPAGISDADKKRPEKRTIWNIVEENSAGNSDNEDDTPQRTTSQKEDDVEKEISNFVSNDINKLTQTTNKKEQSKILANFVKKVLDKAK